MISRWLPNPTSEEYEATLARIAEEINAILIDTQKAFEPVLAHIYPAALGWDRVHPNPIGHMTLARAFLDGIGFSLDR